MTEMGISSFACDNCKGIHPNKFKAFVVEFEGKDLDVCIICDKEQQKEHDATHCNACDVEIKEFKRVRDPDIKKMMNACKVCYKKIKGKSNK